VFEQALRQMLAERSAEQLGRAVVLTAQAMAGAPQAAEDYAISLIRTAQDGVGLLGAIEALPAEQQQEPIMLVLQGTVQGSMGEVTEAQRLFEQALEAQPALTIARLQLVKLMIFQRNFEEAETLLAPLADRSDNSVVSLRVRVLTEKGQVAEALTLINEMIASGSADVPLLISKAQLQLQRGEVEAAEGTLLEALESRPDEERLYEALFDLYDPPGGVASPAADAPRQYQRLLRQILLTIPHSRIARLKRAQLHIAKGELQQGEGLLVGLAQEYPSDMKVLGSLLELYFRSNRGEQAQAILQEKLAAEPNNATLLMLAMRLYQGMGDADGVAQMQERLILLQPVSSARQQGLAVLYLRTKRPAEALAVLDEMLSDPAVEDGHELVGLASWALMDLERFDEAEARLDDAIEKYADHAADLSYQKAMVVRRRGDSARAEQVMMDTLRVHPDHPQTNNDLGYSWTVRHENLEQARAMIQKAVDVDPTSAAYLDSLGWVSYKLGRFEDAEKWLRRSRANGGESAVILDHLADAVYRLGQVQEAQQLWQAAQKLLPQVPVVDDPELVTLGDRLVVKLRAVQQDEVVPVAETAEVPEARAGEEPVGPQTQPASEPAAGVSEGPVDPALGPTTAPAQTQPVGR
jgi:tetratricopeptide (TPR) repeat protein